MAIKFTSGANIDQRPQSERENDIQFKEIVASANPVNWKEKPREEWRKFPIFNQDGSGSCVAQTLAKLLGILYWLKNAIYVHFSATDIFQRRINKPASGMGASDAFLIGQAGVTLEELVPSQGMDDVEMDSVAIPQYKRDVGSVFKIGKPIFLQDKDIETVASVIQTTGKGVMLWFYFKIDEWTDTPTIKYSDLDLHAPNTCRHSVTGVDVILHKGKKAIVIEDSWGSSFGIAGQRVITEDFFKARNFLAAYPMNFKFDDQTKPEPTPAPSKPKYLFSKILKFGMTDADIKALQGILKYEGLFPANVSNTGYYGAVTAQAVLAFQRKYKVAVEVELKSLNGKLAGPKTLAKLNELYS